ncbi:MULTISPECIES: hypothetical protein [unclassified Coleofasciculus]|uniref:hypothetical protein n=1 Tax=unclassified Coleofasciculus TaxID=2692782 RepID=UPI0018806A7D|nr:MULTISPECIES: hypothetical protein [unclassified Coleofasciculus]MBE9129800.1 hypothetical protein [Coleofasciculus sp. LEGE 07081]MBE9149185.1 hypothetical protein [Coleofasciculus sp. LEGE 07092]
MDSHSTEETWQCWMVNTLTGEEKLIAHGYESEPECQLESSYIFAQWQINPYPISEGWTVIYRQDSTWLMARYWRDYYQEMAQYWHQRYEKLCQEYNPAYQPSEQPRRQPPRLKTVKRRRRVLSRYNRSLKRVQNVGWLCAGTLLFASTIEVPIRLKPLRVSQYAKQQATDIPLGVRELFDSKQAPGAIAIGVAEGNLTPTGKPTSIYSGHTDPGNFATNRGFCSWNQAQDISIEEADRRCLQALQWHSVATENRMLDLGLNPENHKKAIVMGTDLWNQSNSAGPNFPFTYKAAKDQGLQGRDAYIWARVEAFRNEQQELDASGLFGICKREPYYRQQLTGLPEDSESWRWNCIKLDQMRRVREIEQVLTFKSTSS